MRRKVEDIAGLTLEESKGKRKRARKEKKNEKK